MPYLTKEERETIILFNQTNEPASIQTYDVKLKKRLASFAKDHPDLCSLKDINEFGGASYELEKSRLSIRLIAPYSEERKEKARSVVKNNSFI